MGRTFLSICLWFSSVVVLIASRSDQNRSVGTEEWNIITMITKKYNIQLQEDSDIGLFLNLTRPSSIFSYSAMHFFPSQKLDRTVFIYMSLLPKTKEFTLLSIRDPDQSVRLAIRCSEVTYHQKQFRMEITLNPLVPGKGNNATVIALTLPFTRSDWTLGIMLSKQKVNIYTNCASLQHPRGYHQHDFLPFIEENLFFAVGATINFFSNGENEIFQGHVSDFIITKEDRAKDLLCQQEETVEGSGVIRTLWTPKVWGNILLTESTTTIETTSSTATTGTTSASTTTKRSTTKDSTSSTANPTKNSKIFQNISRGQRNRILLPDASSGSENYQRDFPKVTMSTSSKPEPHSTTESSPMESVVSGAGRTGNKTTNSPDDQENSECSCLRYIRLNKPQRGEKGTKGAQGPQGLAGTPGAAGTCSVDQCKPPVPTKGEKGERGEKGTCTERTVKQDNVVVKGAKGDKGDSGVDGSHGEKGEKGDEPVYARIVADLIPLIESAAERIVETRMAKLKDDVKSCSCSSDQSKSGINSKTQTVVFSSSEELRLNSFQMAVGQIVFLILENILLVKIDDIKNRWRSVRLNGDDSDWYLSPEPIIAKNVVPKFQPNSMKLMLLALPIPTKGDLKVSSYEPGAYSGSSYLCQKEASVYGFGRSFYPLIHTDMFDFSFMVPENYRYSVPVVNRRNERIADSFSELVRPMNNIQAEIVDFKGDQIMSDRKQPCVWLGRKPTLYEEKYSTDAGLCSNWMSKNPKHFAYSANLKLGGPLIDLAKLHARKCSESCFILCMQIQPLQEEDRKNV